MNGEHQQSHKPAPRTLPPHLQRLHDAATLLYRNGHLAEAGQLYRQALALPDLADHAAPLHTGLGNVLYQRGRLEDAAASYRTALDHAPDSLDARHNLGTVLHQLDRLEEAAACYHAVLARTPDAAATLTNLAETLRALQQREAAIRYFRRALALQPDQPVTHNNLGATLMDLARPAEAIPCFRAAIRLQPGRIDAQYNLAAALLLNGEMAEGWQQYEWRHQTQAGSRHRHGFTQPQWRGEPAAGRTLLVHPEQGLGDTLQFCRYATLAQASGLRVVMAAPPPLFRLLRSLPGVDRLVASGEAWPPFDLHCPMLSLPLALGTTRDTIPATTPYLFADPTAAATWRACLAATTDLRVGLVWAGSPRPHDPLAAEIDRRRSIAPARLAPLFAIPGIAFYSLQKGGEQAPAQRRLIDHTAALHDFADTAALIANLDLVVSVDTAVAHLAGAMARPVWLLDRFDNCWRWLTGRNDSPWYPTLRIYRQPRQGDWESVILRVAEDLRRLAGARPGRQDISPASPHAQQE